MNSGRPNKFYAAGGAGGDGDLVRTTIDSDTNFGGGKLLSGKTNKSQLDQMALSAERRQHSYERERSKSKGKRDLAAPHPSTTAADKVAYGTKKQKMSSVDKLIKKNIRQKGK